VTVSGRRPVIGLVVLLTVLCNQLLEAQDDRGVRVDGKIVIRVGPQDAVSAAERAEQIEGHLARLLNGPVTRPQASIHRPAADRASRVITVNGLEVVTVTPQDAAANGVDVDELAGRWAEQMVSTLESAAQRRKSPGQRFMTNVRGNASAAVAGAVETVVTMVPRALAAALVLALVWITGITIRGLVTIVARHTVRSTSARTLLRMAAYYVVWAIGLFMALDAMGVNAQTLVTGLGLTSVALGFALKDILSNLVSGMLILAFRTFAIGDQIVVGDAEGSVEKIDLRATHIRTYGGRLVLVPNSDVFTSRVTNNTASPVRRAAVDVHLEYREDLPRALQLAHAAAQSTAGVDEHLPIDAHIREFNSDDAVIEVSFWTDSVRSDFMATTFAVRLAVVEALKAAGIDLPNRDVRELVPRDVSAWQKALSRPTAHAAKTDAPRRRAS
jgi:small conductance mechanosensitive channel